MAGSVNKVILVGNLGRDPEVRTMQAGDRLAQFSLATSESWRDRNSGERRERTEWHRVVIFDNNLVDIAERYLRKGSKIYVEGALQTRKWQDQSGQERYTTEVVLQRFRSTLTMLDRAGDAESRDRDQDYGGYGDRGSGGGRSAAPAPALGSDLDDDIPF